MKIRFCANQHFALNPAEEYADVYAEFDVAEVPTKKQISGIEKDIEEAMDEWEEEHGDFLEFNYFACCKEACIKRGIKFVDNPIVVTIYI